ncbi:MAG: hypothetical protein HOK29_13255 [Candidatus Marinimicrobia bacterium]|jgi:hypothetical protein|nr:hypothetical protein [Candidatus Neomarinimicrobiota bacterium]
MNRKILITSKILFLLIGCLSEVQALNAQNIVKNRFSGYWKGEGRIIVAWSEKKTITFDLQIHENGNVTGAVGDAIITQGRIQLNNKILIWLGNKEYIIDADLKHFLNKSEKIKRESIRLFLDFKRPFLTGGFHSSGSKFGGKEKMVLSGTDIKLTKVIIQSGE